MLVVLHLVRTILNIAPVPMMIVVAFVSLYFTLDKLLHTDPINTVELYLNHLIEL